VNVLVRRRQRVLQTPAQTLQQLLLVKMAPRGLLFFGHAGEGRGFLGDGRGFLGGARRSAGFELLGVRIGVGEVESIPATRSVGVARAHDGLANVTQQAGLSSIAVGGVGAPPAYQRSERI